MTEEFYITIGILVFFITLLAIRKFDVFDVFNDEFGLWVLGWVLSLLIAGAAGLAWFFCLPILIGIGLLRIVWIAKTREDAPVQS